MEDFSCAFKKRIRTWHRPTCVLPSEYAEEGAQGSASTPHVSHARTHSHAHNTTTTTRAGRCRTAPSRFCRLRTPRRRAGRPDVGPPKGGAGPAWTQGHGTPLRHAGVRLRPSARSRVRACAARAVCAWGAHVCVDVRMCACNVCEHVYTYVCLCMLLAPGQVAHGSPVPPLPCLVPKAGAAACVPTALQRHKAWPKAHQGGLR